ncbi:gamma-glutamyl cyclotransferase [Devosia geojensis]|uniref:glutathione-specific gamma-glutamylcyclotransferase n=2 Tax=Devosia geojensis TaxID=443610 RepID=A0A0F5FX40_9HYPH|nr:gamma-glutamyl cyclotransferase [Devosia geojensis]
MDATDIGSSAYWVFGYGSLIWNPGFAHVAARPAVLHGAHRSLCIYSHHHRGTPERPGLVFGLVEGGSCRGMAFAVTEADWPGVREYLKAREQVTSVYREATRRVRLDDGREVKALAFLVDRHHDQYAGRLTLAEQARMVIGAVGSSGNNVDYVRNTARHLAELGIRDRQVMALAALLEAAEAGGAGLEVA